MLPIGPVRLFRLFLRGPANRRPRLLQVLSDAFWRQSDHNPSSCSPLSPFPCPLLRPYALLFALFYPSICDSSLDLTKQPTFLHL
jgi:hypothetical protein